MGYGVQPEHFAIVKEALVWTLQRALAERWTPPVAEAWSIAYDALADTMKAAFIRLEVNVPIVPVPDRDAEEVDSAMAKSKLGVAART
eukprot:SM000039S14460  [mRNA]  locus=s39:274497:275314:- [translate_table: standard]